MPVTKKIEKVQFTDDNISLFLHPFTANGKDIWELSYNEDMDHSIRLSTDLVTTIAKYVKENTTEVRVVDYDVK